MAGPARSGGGFGNAQNAASGYDEPEIVARIQGWYSGLVKPITYCIYREDEFFVAQCLNVDVSSFGSSREEAIANLKEAVELYFEDEPGSAYTEVRDAAVGEELVNA